MNLIAPFGFFGAGNIGDESTLQGFARLVSLSQQDVNVWVASRNPSHTGRVEPLFRYYKVRGRDPRRWWARVRAKAHVMFGGTPIMDVIGKWPLSELSPLITSAKEKKRPVTFLGIGTETLNRDESKRIISDIIAPGVIRWSVRCQRDKDRLIEYGVPEESVLVTADLAWLLDSVPLDFGKQYLKELGLDPDAPYVGININGEKFVLRKEPQFFEKIARSMDAIIEQHNVRVLFIANETREGETYDKVASSKVLSQMKYADRAFLLPNLYWAPQKMISLVGCCQATLGIRYHFCLFSALQGVPFIGLNRSDKVTDFCWDMDWPYGVQLDDMSVDELVGMYSQIKIQRESLIEKLQQKTQVMKQRSLTNTVVLDELIAAATTQNIGDELIKFKRV